MIYLNEDTKGEYITGDMKAHQNPSLIDHLALVGHQEIIEEVVVLFRKLDGHEFLNFTV